MKLLFKHSSKLLWKTLLATIITITTLLIIANCQTGHTYVNALSRLGSRGNEVTQIQTKLNEAGLYTGPIDGIFGPATEKSVKTFQKNSGLTADGIVGTKTLSALGVSSSVQAGGLSSSDMELFARIISAEARGEPYNGQVAVAAVILNRIEHPSFPNTLSGVIYQPGAFSCLQDGQVNQPIADSARRAATDALNGWDPSGGAIYYYNPAKTSNKWMLSRPVITIIGGHKFCM